MFPHQSADGNGQYEMRFSVKNCLFCRSQSQPTTIEHIIPESLGNDDLILSGEVCDKCQNYFGKEVENYVLSKTPLGSWRTLLGIRTKRGELPCVELSQPEQSKGSWRDRHMAHDNGIGFGFDVDGVSFIDVANPEMLNEIRSGTRSKFTFVFTPKVLFMLGRFLLKAGLELVCLDNSSWARVALFDDARKYAREGSTSELWPLFHFSEGTLSELRKIEHDLQGPIERFTCYSYRLFQAPGLISAGQPYLMFQLKVGTDVWVVCLSERCPHPIIRESFPGKKLELIWYSKEQLKLRENG